MSDGPPAAPDVETESDVLAEGMRVTRNSLLLGVGEAVGLALGFVTTILVTDRTGADYGLLIGAQRYIALFMVLVQFGLYPLLVRAFASDKADAGAVLGSVLLTRALLGLVLVPIVPGIAWITGYLPGQTWLLLAWLLIECLGVVAETYMAMCEGLERMGRSAAIAIARSSATFVAVVSVTYMEGGLYEYVIAYVCARAAQVVVAIYVGHSALPGIRLQFRFDRIGSLMRSARWYAGMGFVSAVQGSLPVLVLSRVSGTEQTSLFGAALNFLDVVMVLPLLIQRALLPAFSRLAGTGGDQAVAHHSLRLIPMGLIPAAFGLAILSDSVVALYPSGEFDAAAPVLSMIALWLLVIGPGNVAGTYLTGHGRMRALVLINVLGIAIQVLAQVFFVPRFGAVGAAAATMVAYSCVAGITVYITALDGVRPPWLAWARLLASAGVMSAIIYPMRTWPVVVPVTAGVLSYLGCLLVLLPGDSIERRLWRRFVLRRDADLG